MKRLDRDELLAIGLPFLVIAALALWLAFGPSTAKAGCGRMPCMATTCDFKYECGPGCFCHHDNGRFEPGVCLHAD